MLAGCWEPVPETERARWRYFIAVPSDKRGEKIEVPPRAVSRSIEYAERPNEDSYKRYAIRIKLFDQVRDKEG